MHYAYNENLIASITASEQKKIALIQEALKQALSRPYATEYAFINLGNDNKTVEFILGIVRELRTKNPPDIIFVLGIGGSNLGALAIHTALQGLLYNERNSELQCYWLDTVDQEYMYTMCIFLEQALQNKKSVLGIVISKSGTTTETIANAALFIEILKKHNPLHYKNSLVFITDKSSCLYDYGKALESLVLEIPSNIGGRFSVFSTVGLFPLALLGVDIENLIAGAKYALDKALSDNFNPAVIQAFLKYYYYKKGYFVHDLFIFSKQLAELGNWYRQLLAESIGKRHTLDGRESLIGILPTVSIGSTDLHSLGQLYLAGPRIILTSFIFCENQKYSLMVPDTISCVKNIAQKSLADIMQAIAQGTKKAYEKNQRPFSEFIFSAITPFTLGEFLQYCMLEMVYLGALLDLNPFDQPEVEHYKQETRKILANE